jgi:hypothetical protein
MSALLVSDLHEIHFPYEPDRSRGSLTMCHGCRTVWPCPTERAIRHWTNLTNGHWTNLAKPPPCPDCTGPYVEDMCEACVGAMGVGE